MITKPSLVNEAQQLAHASGFSNSCLDEVGELLHLLAGHQAYGKIADIGTGCGVSTAWLASATSLPIYTIDNDEGRVREVKRLFSTTPNVVPLCGDWEHVLAEGTFHLVFVDAKPAKLYGTDAIIKSTDVGGLIVIDDLTPGELWPEAWNAQRDLVRETWLNHPQLHSVEIRTSRNASAILARRK